MKGITWGNYYWPVFLTGVSVLFLVPEIVGLVTNSANTLSDYCWRRLSVAVSYGQGIHTLGWWFSLIAWGLFVILITIHIWWRGV